MSMDATRYLARPLACFRARIFRMVGTLRENGSLPACSYSHPLGKAERRIHAARMPLEAPVHPPHGAEIDLAPAVAEREPPTDQPVVHEAHGVTRALCLGRRDWLVSISSRIVEADVTHCAPKAPHVWPTTRAGHAIGCARPDSAGQIQSREDRQRSNSDQSSSARHADSASRFSRPPALVDHDSLAGRYWSARPEAREARQRDVVVQLPLQAGRYLDAGDMPPRPAQHPAQLATTHTVRPRLASHACPYSQHTRAVAREPCARP